MDEIRYPVELVKTFDKQIVGQYEYKESVAMAIYKQCYKNTTQPIMVIAPTGSGKTFLFDVFKNSSMKPQNYTITSINISRLTEEGVHGQDLDDIFISYKEQCQLEGNRQMRGLIYIDEIDKLISPSIVTNGDTVTNKNAQIQHQLMQILDGGTIAGIDTKKVLFVFGGAFHQLDYIEIPEVRHNPIGFVNTPISTPDDRLLAEKSIRDELLEIGFQREFLGRITKIVRLKALNRTELKAILLHPSRGEISKLKKEYASDGIELEIKDDAVDQILDAVVSENLGARSVSNILEQLLDGVWFRCIANDYNKVVIDKNADIKYMKVRKKETVQVP